MWRKLSSQDKEGWCLEVSHEYFYNVLFVKQKMISMDEEVDEEVVFETTSQVEEGEAPRIINTNQDT